MLALIDADILLYRIGFTTEDETEAIAKVRMNKYIDDITFSAECSDYKLYLTDSKGNYRNTLYPEYKANRAGMQKPKHYAALKEYLIKYEAAIVAHGQEADDALGIEQTILGDESVICSIDKDLLMIPGWHYHLVKGEKTRVTPEEGIRRFYLQVLTGDTVDNIPGLRGIGPKKAKAILEDLDTEEQYKKAVYDAYVAKSPELSEEDIRKRIQLIGQLLWIRRKPDEMWSY
jgi:5'-3' exonuclease